MKVLYMKLSVIGLSIFLGVGAIVVLAQKENNQKKNVKQNTEADVQKFVISQGVFSKMSSSEEPIDDGFKIVSIKRKFIYANNAVDDGTKRKDFIEIALTSHIAPAATAMMDIIQIGDKIFFPDILSCGDSKYCIKVYMSPQEFDELKDNTLVTLYKGMPPDSKMLKELYKNGEPDKVRGAKFGRLKKEKINEHPVTEKKSN